MNPIKVNPIILYGLCCLALVLLYLQAADHFSVTNTVPVDVESRPITSTALLNTVEELKQEVKSMSNYLIAKETNLKLAVQANSERNLAPQMQTFADNCKEPLLWGNDHHGGWFICKDFLPKEECIVYSYGLGKIIFRFLWVILFFDFNVP